MLDVDIEALNRCMALLDEQFASLVGTAKAKAKAFADAESGSKRLLPVVISVSEDKRYRSVTIRWCKVKKPKPGSKRKVNLEPLRKGRDTHSYAQSSFGFIEPSTRAVVMEYEESLSLIRYALARNSSIYGQIARTIKGLQKMSGAN